MKNDMWLTPTQFALKIGKSRQWVWELIKTGKIAKKYLKVVGGRTFIKEDAVIK